jgi:hypothetical protein
VPLGEPVGEGEAGVPLKGSCSGEGEKIGEGGADPQSLRSLRPKGDLNAGDTGEAGSGEPGCPWADAGETSHRGEIGEPASTEAGVATAEAASTGDGRPDATRRTGDGERSAATPSVEPALGEPAGEGERGGKEEICRPSGVGGAEGRSGTAGRKGAASRWRQGARGRVRARWKRPLGEYALGGPAGERERGSKEGRPSSSGVVGADG